MVLKEKAWAHWYTHLNPQTSRRISPVFKMVVPPQETIRAPTPPNGWYLMIIWEFLSHHGFFVEHNIDIFSWQMCYRIVYDITFLLNVLQTYFVKWPKSKHVCWSTKRFNWTVCFTNEDCTTGAKNTINTFRWQGLKLSVANFRRWL